jgi:hypothetical protein
MFFLEKLEAPNVLWSIDPISLAFQSIILA